MFIGIKKCPAFRLFCEKTPNSLLYEKKLGERGRSLAELTRI